MSATVGEVLSRLPDALPVGAGWQASCPAHSDAERSLDLTEGDGGEALLECREGCDTYAVARALWDQPVARTDAEVRALLDSAPEN